MENGFAVVHYGEERIIMAWICLCERDQREKILQLLLIEKLEK